MPINYIAKFTEYRELNFNSFLKACLWFGGMYILYVALTPEAFWTCLRCRSEFRCSLATLFTDLRTSLREMRRQFCAAVNSTLQMLASLSILKLCSVLCVSDQRKTQSKMLSCISVDLLSCQKYGILFAWYQDGSGRQNPQKLTINR